MGNLTISIFGNKIFSEIVSELKLFSKYKTKNYDDINLYAHDAVQDNQLSIFFLTEENKKDYEKVIKNNFPLIVITKFTTSKNILPGEFVEKLTMPFRALDLKKKIVSLLAKYEFSNSSLINLRGYIIDKNERKIKKNNLELQLSEKEVDFLILFSASKEPIKRDLVLKKVWNYSQGTETHTVETHIHRLRKKILDKFNDNDFIKNNKEGYYI